MLGKLALITLVCLAAYGVGSCTYQVAGFDEDYNREKAQEEAAIQEQARKNAVPRMVSTDGTCETWAFLPQGGKRWLYFARCDGKTTTYNQWEECRTVSQGKTSRQECETKQLEIEQLSRSKN